MVVVAAVAYGDGGGGIPGVHLGSPRDKDGRLVMLGTGRQHWSTVHAADLADFFRRALEEESARGRYIVHNGLNPTVAELAEAAVARPPLRPEPRLLRGETAAVRYETVRD